MVKFFMIIWKTKHGTIVGASWEEIIPGCTDPYAENYNENANSMMVAVLVILIWQKIQLVLMEQSDYIDLGQPSDLNFTPQFQCL